ncbi:MAG: class I SAM-dependent methyltransferase [Acidobacteria bacterium]|nr:class I SAM-dependent methyltransferase [Acidobacteriota bacterium]
MNRVHRWYCKSFLWKKVLHVGIVPWALKALDLGENVLEVGPGPGLTTDILRQQFSQVTSIEIDPKLADSLKHRLADTNVRVIEGDATKMPFEDQSFTGAVSFTMLHHVPAPALQDRLLAEVYRVLKPGGIFAGTDSTWSMAFQLFHLFDTMVMVEPDTFGKRLEAVGFRDVEVEVASKVFRFRAKRP